MQQIVQVNFQFSITDIEFESGALATSKNCAEILGLQRKIWLFNKEKKQAGGIYSIQQK